jgi:hypothetical protein
MAKSTRTSSEPNPWFEQNAKHRYLTDQVKRGPLKGLFADPNVQGMAYGRREAHGERTEEPALVVYVARKTPARFLPPSRHIPRRWYIGGDCLEIDVIETGYFYPFAFTARERPVPSGISIGNANETSAGTLGCYVIDNTDGSTCILSNNHVLARTNAAALGEVIIQQGAFDGGSSPADDIATLKRFIMMNATGNLVDAGIAQVGNLGDIIDQMKDNLMPIANADHPAVGLLFAGSCNRTLMNPINDVLNLLNISFTSAGAGGVQPTVRAEIGMNVEKVGRTTEYTTSTITEIDVTVPVSYNTGTFTFDNQIATMWMSDPGDSGSLICRGGEGSAISNCGCGSQSAASVAIGRDLRTEGQMATEIRDKYLRHTKIGRWAVDLFYRNEEKFLQRFRDTKLDQDDVEYARKLYDKYAEDARIAAAAPEQSKQTVNKTHISDAKQALSRAKKYLTKEEYATASKLFEMGSERLSGQTVSDALRMLQDEKLLAELQAMAEEVPTVRTDDPSCRSD